MGSHFMGSHFMGSHFTTGVNDMQAYPERMAANFLPLHLPSAKAGNRHMAEWKSLTIRDGPSHRPRVNLPSPPIRRRIAKSSFFGDELRSSRWVTAEDTFLRVKILDQGA